MVFHSPYANLNKRSMPASASIPTAEELCLNNPLYTKVVLTKEHQKSLMWFLNGNNQFDCYCVNCKQVSTFKNPPALPQLDIPVSHLSEVRNLVFKCSRNLSHSYSFVFQVHNSVLTKIGQFPSAADIASNEVDRYENLLKDDAHEFKRAIGLAAHGIGIGSFVYLRRIIENLIEEQHQVVKLLPDWNEDKYLQVRFKEKLDLIESVAPGSLPELISKNQVVYGLLSKGIHSLTEEECLEAFPTLKNTIELVLDDKLAAKARAEKLKSVQTELGQLGTKHK